MEQHKWLQKKTKHTCKIMKKDIYNKNAREAYLMAEAYDNIYKDINEVEDAETRLGAINEFPDGEGKYEVVDVGGMHGQSKMGGKKFNSLADASAYAGIDPSEITSEEWIDMEGDGTTLEFMVDEDTAIVMHKNVPAEDNEEAQAYRDMSDRYKAEDSIEVGNVYKGESYHELVIGIKGDEVFTKKITLEDGNRYDKKQMLDEVKLAGKIKHDFLNEIM